MAIQRQKGFHVIKRNQSLKTLKMAEREGVVRNDSDDSSNASMTEATLEVLYGSSIDIQQKLGEQQNMNNPEKGELIKKLKKMIRLEDIKKSVLECNMYKLEHR